MTRHLIVLSVIAAVTISAGAALAQGAFPAPLDTTTMTPDGRPAISDPAYGRLGRDLFR